PGAAALNRRRDARAARPRPAPRSAHVQVVAHAPLVVEVDDVDVPGAGPRVGDGEGGAVGVADVAQLPVAVVGPGLDVGAELHGHVPGEVGRQLDGERRGAGGHADAVGVVVGAAGLAGDRAAGHLAEAHVTHVAEVAHRAEG